MKKTMLTLSIILATCVGVTHGQAVFKKYGFNKKPLTLSKGKYNEFFPNDVVVQIGTVRFNTRTNKVIQLLEEDTTKTNYLSDRSSIWYSVDPLAEKFPNYSPYVYCYNNPVIYVDPDGKFGLSVHKEILLKALSSNSKSAFSFSSIKDMKYGVGILADVVGMASDNHFDGRQNYREVSDSWTKLNSEIDNTIDNIGYLNKKIGGTDVMKLGKLLHTVADFYAHSNYVDLYVEYHKSKNNGALPTSIPTLIDGQKDADFNKLLTEKLRTGDFDFFDNEKTNPNGVKAQLPTSHNKMNKDNDKTYLGKLAKQAAIKHTKQILKTIEEQ